MYSVPQKFALNLMRGFSSQPIISQNIRRNLCLQYFNNGDNKSHPAKYQQQIRSSNSRMTHSGYNKPGSVTTKKTLNDIMAVWPDVVKDILQIVRDKDLHDITDWIEELMEYNVPHGKKIRALITVSAFDLIAPPELQTEENRKLAKILAWVIEMSQGYILLTDDILDGSQTRRGKPCWHTLEKVGISAANDGHLLKFLTYQLLRLHFEGKECYLDLMETMQDNLFYTTLGQLSDILNLAPRNNYNLDFLTMERFSALTKHKTSYPTFVLPIKFIMQFIGMKDPELYRHVEDWAFSIGLFYQIQNDYLDCYADQELTGKQGTDIEEGKCSWLAITALQKVTPAQRKVFQECYGRNDPEKVKRVKELYDDLKLPTLYASYEEESFNKLNEQIKQLPRELPPKLFSYLTNKIYCKDA